MKSIFKWLGIVIAAVAVLVIVAVIAVPLLIDADDVRDELAARVKQSTGRDLKIVGDADVTVFPWVGVELGAMQLGNAPGFSQKIFASTQRVSVRVKLMPLLKGQLEADTIVVDGLVLNLERNAKGLGNWEDLAPRGAQSKSSSASSSSAAQGGAAAELAALSVGGISVDGATVTWVDALSGQSLSIDALDLRTGAFGPGTPTQVDLGFNLKIGTPKLEGRVESTTIVTVDANKSVAILEPLKFDVALSGESLPGGKAALALAANRLRFDAKAGHLDLEGLSASLLDFALTGQAKVDGIGAKLSYSGRIDVAQFSLRKLLQALELPVPDTADKAAFRKVGLRTQFAGTPTQVKLDGFEFQLDDTLAKGNLALLDFALPVVRFDINVNEINVDRYLPPRSAKEAAKESGSKGSTKAQAPVTGKPDYGPIRRLDLEGKAQLAKLTVSGLLMSKAKLQVSAKKGLINLKPISAALYEGTYTGNIVVDVRKDKPRLTINEQLTGVQAGPLLKGLTGKDAITGTAKVGAKMNAVGEDVDALKRTLNGTVKFRFDNGALNGVNIARLIRDAKAKISGQSLPPEKQALKTDFSEMSASMKFKKGVGNNKDFLAKSPLLRSAGVGRVDLVKELVKYKVKTTIVASAKGQGGKDLDGLAGVTIPVDITGSLHDPSYGVDVAALGATLAKSQGKKLLGAKTKNLTKALKGKTGGAAAKGLKSLLGN